MASESEQIVDHAMEGKKPLGLIGRLESTHLSFPLARPLMRSLHSIIGVTLGRVSHVAEADSERGRVASQFVGDDSQWFGALAPQESSKEPFCGAP